MSKKQPETKAEKEIRLDKEIAELEIKLENAVSGSLSDFEEIRRNLDNKKIILENLYVNWFTAQKVESYTTPHTRTFRYSRT
jgi:hypothetical protein